jgi:hypothetical protein
MRTIFAAILLSLSLALAAVTLDFEDGVFTGTGFVGKGDVQLAFGWNNAELQRNASGVGFSYSAVESLEQDCASNDRGTFTVVGQRTKTEGISASVTFDARQRNQITGFTLTGLGSSDYTNTGWVGPNGETTDNACPAGTSPLGAVRVTSTGTGTLTVWHNGVGHALN